MPRRRPPSSECRRAEGRWRPPCRVCLVVTASSFQEAHITCCASEDTCDYHPLKLYAKKNSNDKRHFEGVRNGCEATACHAQKGPHFGYALRFGLPRKPF